MVNSTTDTTLASDLGIGLGCFNCNGLGSDKKRELVLKWLEGKEDGIIFLQETHSTPEKEAAWKSSWDGEIAFGHGSSNSTGVAIMIKRRALNEIDIVKTVLLEQGRALLVEVNRSGSIFTLVNVYCPNNDDADFIRRIFFNSIEMADHNSKLIFGGGIGTPL